ncbi:ATP-dependent DNA helicase RecG [Patescibacteria group bacterium]|nr:MAG: ATP-dependent DNA helicase RecG [Patescibacteria group bacterium]
MALHLGTPVTALPGVGSETAKDLKTLDVVSVRDLLLYFPYRYDDYSRTLPIAKLRHDDTATVVGTVEKIATRPANKNPKLKLTEAVISDESGEIKVMWFNQPYLEKSLRAGTRVSLAGRMDAKFGGKTLVNPVWEPAGQGTHTGRLVPVYPLTRGLTVRRLRTAIKAALPATQEMEEWLPLGLLSDEGFGSEGAAIAGIHFPESKEALEKAVDRLKFDELFLHQLQYADIRRQAAKRDAHPIPVDEAGLKSFVATLPFALTPGQRRAAWEIVKDMGNPHPMNRLLQGDVGSGKTAVSAIAASSALNAGLGVAYLAPTEILASQQHAAFCRFFPSSPVALYTASQCLVREAPVPRDELFQAIRNGDVRFVIGTHALFQGGVDLPKLGLVVIDEQHRFGVEQRRALLEDDPAPHLLSMTATPIPRSLALTLYGDLELSVIPDRPKGRKPIATFLVTEGERKAVWEKVREEVATGHQAYVVCPLIEESEKIAAKSVSETASMLSKGDLKGLRIGMLHGKMTSPEKAEAIEEFRSGEIDVLVATTVVEVGVDVQNATAIVIVGAERFGLAQLHQLRGRVGRGEAQSYCFLLPDALTKPGEKRLQAMVESDDGFALAETDLQLRGAGNLFGNAQSGFPDFKLATLADVPLMKRARDAASKLLAEDPELSGHPVLKEKVKRSFDRVHLE